MKGTAKEHIESYLSIIEANSLDQIHTWFARSQQDYQQAVSLGWIDGYGSWEQYEAITQAIKDALGKKVIVVDASPNEIAARLEQECMEDTPQNRVSLYPIWDLPAGSWEVCDEVVHIRLEVPEGTIIIPSVALREIYAYALTFYNDWLCDGNKPLSSWTEFLCERTTDEFEFFGDDFFAYTISVVEEYADDLDIVDGITQCVINDMFCKAEEIVLDATIYDEQDWQYTRSVQE